MVRIGLTIVLIGLMTACGSPKAEEGNWTQWGAGSGEINYLNTNYIKDSGEPLVIETMDVFRTLEKPAKIRAWNDRREIWCLSNQTRLISRQTSVNGSPFETRPLISDITKQTHLDEFDERGSRAPPNKMRILSQTVCSRQFRDRISDPVAHFLSVDSK